MKIDADERRPGVVNITVTNINQPLVNVWTEGEGLDYKIKLTTVDGRDVKRTEYGMIWLKLDIHGGSRFSHRIKAGESRSEDLDLGKFFELKPGKHTVAISRWVGLAGSATELHASASFTIS